MCVTLSNGSWTDIIYVRQNGLPKSDVTVRLGCCTNSKKKKSERKAIDQFGNYKFDDVCLLSKLGEYHWWLQKTSFFFDIYRLATRNALQGLMQKFYILWTMTKLSFMLKLSWLTYLCSVYSVVGFSVFKKYDTYWRTSRKYFAKQ